MEFDDGARRVLRVAAFLGWVVYAWFVWRSERHAARLANQSGTTASREWRGGKRQVGLGVLGLFIVLQDALPIPQPYRAIAYFTGFPILLLWGEWRVGSGFRVQADAQEMWKKRYPQRQMPTFYIPPDPPRPVVKPRRKL